MFCVPCPTCKGSGVVRSDATLAAEIFRKIQAEAPGGSGLEVVVRVHPDMARYLEVDERDGVERLQALVGRKLAVQGVPTFHREEYEVSFR